MPREITRFSLTEIVLTHPPPSGFSLDTPYPLPWTDEFTPKKIVILSFLKR